MKIAIHSNSTPIVVSSDGEQTPIVVSSEDNQTQTASPTPSRSPSPDMVKITGQALEAAALESEACFQELLRGIMDAYAKGLPPLLED
jgi:hypothetical protein